MNDIEQIKNFFHSLSKGEKAEININIPVTGKAFFECLEINRQLCQQVRSPVYFSPKRLTYPHITLKMGKIKSESDLLSLMEILDGYFRNLGICCLQPMSVILKEPKNNYYFSEVDDLRLQTVSRELDEILSGLMDAPRYCLDANNLHHITLGYRFAEDTVCEGILDNKISEFSFDRVSVSVTGKFGVCLGELKTYYLNSMN